MRGAKVLGVGCDRDQRLGRDLEQEIVDHGLVLGGDAGDDRRQREHDMEVRHRQQIGLARRQPVLCRRALALRAVPVAAPVVGDRRVRTVLAARDVTAESQRTAALDGAHHLHLGKAHVATVGVTPSGAVVAEDIRDLQGGTGHNPCALCRRSRLLLSQRRQPVERTHDRTDGVGGTRV